MDRDIKIATEFFPPSYFDQLAKVEAGHWWFRSRNRILLWVFKKHVGSFNRFLEVGCGTGFVLQGVRRAFPKAELHGTEYFEKGLKHARKRLPSVNFTQLDARNMDDQKHYDVIGAFDVIEHIDEDLLVLSNLSRALKQGGVLLVTVPQHRWLWSKADEYACHRRRYTRLELLDKVTQFDLSIEYVTSFVSLLLPLMWLRRLNINITNYDPMDEFRIPSLLNKLLEKIMFFELCLLKIGIRFPFGGSLLLLARKKN